MIYLLDTNVCVRYLNGRALSVRQKLTMLSQEEIAVCSIVKADLFYGAMKSLDSVRTLTRQKAFIDRFVSFPFDDHCAEIYGHLRHQLEKHGTPIGPQDMMIAAIALANNLTLVTHNTREFSRIEGMQVEDWEATG